MTGVLRTDHGQRPEEKAGKAVFGRTGAPTGTLIKTASQAVSTLPAGGRRLGEVVLPKGRQLGEERIGGNRLNRGRMCFWFRSGVGEPKTEMFQNYVWIVPPIAERSPSSSKIGNRYGTTLRVYDPLLKAWRITWINPVSGVYSSMVGRRRGNDIVQDGTATDGSLMRWSSVDLTPDSFRWLGEQSPASGRTWNLWAEFRLRRTTRHNTGAPHLLQRP